MKENEPIRKTYAQFTREMQPGILYRIIDYEVILNAGESIILVHDELQVQHSQREHSSSHRKEAKEKKSTRCSQ